MGDMWPHMKACVTWARSSNAPRRLFVSHVRLVDLCASFSGDTPTALRRISVHVLWRSVTETIARLCSPFHAFQWQLRRLAALPSVYGNVLPSEPLSTIVATSLPTA